MKVGIVGLPNAGKSSLFNALAQAGAEAANYPFTTIEPNVAVVPVADERLDAVAETLRASNVVYDTVEFHDIAGLVAGAHKGEGLGNKFLGNIRETDALVHVVRCHRDANIIHPEGEVDPLRDIETIETELIYADLEQAERRHARVIREARGGDRAAVAEEAWLRRVIEALQAGKPARTVPAPADAPEAMRNLWPLTGKPVLFVANVDEGDTEVPPGVAAHAEAISAGAVAVSSRLEAELRELDDEEGLALREEMGLPESGLQRLDDRPQPRLLGDGDLVAAARLADDALVAPLGLLEVGVDELGLDRLDVGGRVDAALGVDDVLVVVRAHDVQEGVALADVGEELVAEPLPLGRARHEARDVVELDRVPDDVRRLDGRGDLLEALVADGHDGDVRLDRREGVVRRLGAGLAEGVEQRGLARVGHPHEADLHHRPRLPRTVPSAAPAAMSDG